MKSVLRWRRKPRGDGRRRWQPRMARTRNVSRNVLLTHGRGAVEIAFDNENGCVIVEMVAAKICCRVVNADHEILGGQRITVAHRREKALKAEFFAKQVLCL